MNRSFKTGISVVIPTYNRSDLIKKTLQQLCQQTLAAQLFEVIVADDGSTDNSKDVILSFQHLLPLTYVYQPDRGFRVAQARNLALKQAKFEFVLFIDSGVLIAADCLEQHFQAHQRQQAEVFIGFCYGFQEYPPVSQQQKQALFDQPDVFADLTQLQPYIDCRHPYFASRNFSCQGLREPWLLFWTCHASCRTAHLLQIGGFDEHFTSWGGEDVELALRLQQAGARFEVLPTAHAIHYPHDKDADATSKSSSQNIRYIHQKHCTLATYLLLQEVHWQQILQICTLPEVAPCNYLLCQP